jgi:dTDP-4-amino-4,6-dideoxygalactose transaminase
MNPSIPFLDLVTPHAELEAELMEVVRTALQSAAFIGGKSLQSFEQNFAAFTGAAECVGVASGTDALRFALIAGGVKPGDTVLTVANTFIATAEAITQAGAVPEFIEVDEQSQNMSPVKLREYLEGCALDASSGLRLSRRSGAPITAVLPVHLFGRMADMDGISEIAQEFQLLLFEDACQAHGAEYFSNRENRWQKAGAVGRAAAFSFYPGKNLGACGEAGATTTNDPALARQIRMIRDHGQASKYYHDVIGYNGRLDSIQAGFLDVKLKHLPRWTEQRRAAAARYDALLQTVPGVVAPVEPPGSKSAYHLYVVRVSHRDQVLSKLTEAGIGTGIHYPVPVHLQNAYADLGYQRGDLPVTEKLSSEILSLPMFPHLTAEDQQRVVRELAKAIESLPKPISDVVAAPDGRLLKPNSAPLGRGTPPVTQPH